ncbi:MAG: DUF4410 domain-containing protein [Acidobacteriota bacterium]
MFSSRPARALCLCVCLVISLPLAAETLDDGLLELSWFGDGIEFHDANKIDYLWVRDGFRFEGQSVHFEEWPEPELIGPEAEERDVEDRRLARQMASDLHRIFQDAWTRHLDIESSLEEGDLLVTGRIVDCSTGNQAAKMLVGFGAGAGYVTIDLKVTDKASGDLMMAIHHRVVSGTGWSTTDSKFAKWVEKAAKKAAKEGGFAALYADGDPADD